MVATVGLVGLRPDPKHVARVTTPPYDVIKSGSALERRLKSEDSSLYHVVLGSSPAEALASLQNRGALTRDEEPAYYVYEQRWSGQSRTGVLVAAAVSDYREGQIIRHERTFDEKVRGRVALANATGYTIGPVFLLTPGDLSPVLERAKEQGKPLYEFESDFGGGTDLHEIRNRVWRVAQTSDVGRAIREALEPHPLYIADGHHRYHAALCNQQTHFLAYVTEEARILAYNRVVNGVVPFAEIADHLDLKEATTFETPPKHHFSLYSKEDCWTLAAKEVPDDVVGRLDCAILEHELYPLLGLTHEHIVDPARFDYYPESALEEMKAVVDDGSYELAIALHPVDLDELMAVADAGLDQPDVVMPEKSTFFSPKILTGLFLYRHVRRS